MCGVYNTQQQEHLSKNYSISTIAVPFDSFWTVLQLYNCLMRCKIQILLNLLYLRTMYYNYYYIGCGKCWTVDGNWKLTFPHCMFPVHVSMPDFPLLKIPDVCTNQPVNSQTAFCEHHCTVVQERGYPTGVRDFIMYTKGEFLPILLQFM